MAVSHYTPSGEACRLGASPRERVEGKKHNAIHEEYEIHASSRLNIERSVQARDMTTGTFLLHRNELFIMDEVFFFLSQDR